MRTTERHWCITNCTTHPFKVRLCGRQLTTQLQDQNPKPQGLKPQGINFFDQGHQTQQKSSGRLSLPAHYSIKCPSNPSQIKSHAPVQITLNPITTCLPLILSDVLCDVTKTMQ